MTNTSNQRKVICDNFYYEKKGTKTICIQDEIPFEIPENWRWTRLQNVCKKIVDGAHNPPKGEEHKTDYLMLSAANINNDELCDFEKARYLIKNVFEKENERTKIKSGDILLTTVGTLGRSCIFKGEKNVVFQRSVTVIATIIFDIFLKDIFDSGFMQNYMSFNSVGTAQKGFYLNQLSSLLIPIPPMAEQKRIGTKTNAIRLLLKNIESRFGEEKLLASILKQKILESVFGENSSYKSYYQQILLKDVCKLDKGQYTSGKAFPYLEAKVIRGVKEAKIIDSGILIEKGTDVILVDGENSGEVMTAPCDGYMGSTFRILKADYSKVTRDYLLLFLLFNKKMFKDNKKGSAIPHLNKKIFNELKIVIPDLTAQQSITKKINNELALLDLIG